MDEVIRAFLEMKKIAKDFNDFRNVKQREIVCSLIAKKNNKISDRKLDDCLAEVWLDYIYDTFLIFLRIGNINMKADVVQEYFSIRDAKDFVEEYKKMMKRSNEYV